MENVFMTVIVVFTAFVFYALGGRKAEKRRNAARTGALKNEEGKSRSGQTERTGTMHADKTESGRRAAYCSAIAEGYANMATGGAFEKSKKREVSFR